MGSLMVYELTTRVILWTLGVSYYYRLTGRLIYGGDSQREINSYDPLRLNRGLLFGFTSSGGRRLATALLCR